METLDDNYTKSSKQRHGCVTACLILMIVANSLAAISYLFAGDLVSQNFPGGISSSLLILLAIMGIGNVIFSVLLYNWKKIGFWGFLLTSLVALVINLSLGLGIAQSIFGLAGIAILYGVLQIKQENATAWDNLD
ncbi:MAG: hypothetical protein ACI8XB_001929 [Patiriisocius sp.]|jgi:hypothetical protein